MSRYKVIETEFRSAESLGKALQDVLGAHKWDQSPLDRPAYLYGYTGDQRPEQAQFIIRRQVVNRYSGGASNDIGFAWNGQAYTAIVSEYDGGREGVTTMLNKVRQRYARHEIWRQARNKGYTVQENSRPDGSILLTLVRR